MSEAKEVYLTPEDALRLKEECKEKIRIAEAYKRLEQNADFQKVFLQEYLEKEPKRLVHLLGEASYNYGGTKEEKREDIQERMIGIARLCEYTRNISAIAQMAQKNLDNIEIAENEHYDN